MEKLRQLFSNPELRKRLLFTLGLLVIYRLGVHVSVPGVNAEALAKNLGKAGDLLNVVDLFSGGAFKKFSVFALGITPYITASIVLQLMGAVVPTLENLQKKEGEAGRQKINQWTRYLTVGLAFIQGFGIASLAQSLGPDVVINPGMGFKLLCAWTLATGTIFVMWIGEQITDRGVGNGISLLIFAGIVAGLPKALETIGTMFTASLKNAGNVAPPGVFILLVAGMAVVVLAVVLVENAYRNIPIHYARRVDSSRMASQRSSYLPLKVNTAGVMPVIFASSVIFFPATIAQFTHWEWLAKASSYVSPQSHFWTYTPIFVGVVIFFAFFYTSIVFNPDETAENMKRSGGYIPGIRPGKETSVYMDSILSKLTFAGAVYLAVISIVPLIITNSMPGLNFYFGGTSLLIVVGVAMDTVAQLESYQVMRRYDGFLEKGRIRGGRLAKGGARS
ncbi:preprotein translocase subunit SecY [Mesoterricola sediminis]|uniref:Protein translocase subunit SecY n=1 Tax=Mesoterricola sediminis TaxID=2927980 RepID=A0AA48KEC9_9BACT|nr:preprotein translocase subunit SecY [Mesoterricola sediminis]BDU75338.1 protein translocase subunit SecY [Mesoterricola sediminis]